jgi:serine/threonine protein phosphatase 1
MTRSTPDSRLRTPSLPAGVRIYAIGDIHGRVDLLLDVLRKIDHDKDRHPTSRSIEVFLGDCIDRGPQAREVIQTLVERKKISEVVCLRGNHESLLEQFLERPDSFAQWRELGGGETLLSYDLAAPMRPTRSDEATLARALLARFPASHRTWLRELRNSFELGDYFFVHAGVRPGIPLDRQSQRDLLWIRREFLEWQDYFEKMIIHGHTPVDKPTFKHNRINIDTGAYATGTLTCLILEHHERFLL